MSDMIEKLARALWNEQRMGDSVEYDVLFAFRKEELRDEVRAVLEALREPTPEMVEAGSLWHGLPDSPIALRAAREAYTAMIDSLLTEKRS